MENLDPKIDPTQPVGVSTIRPSLKTPSPDEMDYPDYVPPTPPTPYSNDPNSYY